MIERVPRTTVIDLLAKARIQFATPSQNNSLLVDFHIEASVTVDTLRVALAQRYDGVSNGHLSEIYEALVGERVEVVGPCAERLPCPCCGYLTLTERYNPAEGTGYDICEHCDWEDEGIVDPSRQSSINRGSMADYRDRMKSEPNFFYTERWLVPDPVN